MLVIRYVSHMKTDNANCNELNPNLIDSDQEEINLVRYRTGYPKII